MEEKVHRKHFQLCIADVEFVYDRAGDGIYCPPIIIQRNLAQRKIS